MLNWCVSVFFHLFSSSDKRLARTLLQQFFFKTERPTNDGIDAMHFGWMPQDRRVWLFCFSCVFIYFWHVCISTVWVCVNPFEATFVMALGSPKKWNWIKLNWFILQGKVKLTNIRWSYCEGIYFILPLNSVIIMKLVSVWCCRCVNLQFHQQMGTAKFIFSSWTSNQFVCSYCLYSCLLLTQTLPFVFQGQRSMTVYLIIHIMVLQIEPPLH